jgi:hypothetical protein
MLFNQLSNIQPQILDQAIVAPRFFSFISLVTSLSMPERRDKIIGRSLLCQAVTGCVLQRCSMKHCEPIHAYRLAYPDSLHAPERLWEWEKVHVACLLWNATAFGRELTHRYFLTWAALAQENQRIWETYYLPRPLYESWETWHAWLAEYRELVRDVQDVYEENHGHKHNDRRPPHQDVQERTSSP